MSHDELVAEIRAAASSLLTAAAAAENRDYVAAEIGVEDALFRTQSLQRRLQQMRLDQEVAATSPPVSRGPSAEEN